MSESGVDQTAVIDPAADVDGSAVIGPLAYVGVGCRIGPGVSVGVRATLTGSPHPGHLVRPDTEYLTIIGDGAVIGDGALVRGPVTVGPGAVVEPGAVVLDDVPAHSIVAGNPAAVVGYTHSDLSASAPIVAAPSDPGESIEIAGCSFVRLPQVVDLRGALTFAEVDDNLPFVPRRMFVVYDVPNQKVRGSHAHYELHEFIIAVGGSVTVTVDNGVERGQVVLDDPTLALHLRPMTWTTQYAFTAGAALVVLASHPYEDADYIRDYSHYLEVVDGA